MTAPRERRAARAASTGRRRKAKSPPPPRVVVAQLLPEVDGGRYPAKRAEGERITVTAHLVCDSHDLVSAVLLHRTAPPVGEPGEWVESPMEPTENDEYVGSFLTGEPGRYEYTVEAWVDRLGTWREDLEKRVAAGWDVSSELLEGAELLRTRTRPSSAEDGDALARAADRIQDAEIPVDERAAFALEESFGELLSRSADRLGASRYHRELRLTVDETKARFSAWYEMFPRSAGTDPQRGATLREAAARLTDIAAMGFDVLYLPPVHPIGHTARKGPNNALHAGPEDPGSPWAIGSEEGGHTAVHPDLGTIADFDWFVAEAAKHGLDVALDIAFQCSPDHPWVREHPDWFRHRPDGTIKYAENPPKQYQDVYPLDFECADWENLWAALRDVFTFWLDHGVRIFRVDNPHTKPFPFWEWVIDEITRERPDAIFLAEAFTRPKRMATLAKMGFNQSYSYFTWRNTKQELTEYFTELSQPPVSDYMRANLFANTPDILHEYLQVGGRPAFLVRLVLAATLGPAYGIYSGYELIEHEAHPGTEEYVDSDKYQVKVRNWEAPGNIKPAISTLNRLRRELPALQYNHDLWFLPLENEELFAYMKSDPAGGGHVLVVVNLDVRYPQSGWVGLPMGELGLNEQEPYVVHDVLNGQRHLWRGSWNFVRIDPADASTVPAHVIVIEGHSADERRVEGYA